MCVVVGSNEGRSSALVVRTANVDLLRLAHVNGAESSTSYRFYVDNFVWSQNKLHMVYKDVIF